MDIAELIFVDVEFIHLKSVSLRCSHLRGLGLSSKDLGELLLKSLPDFSGGEHNVLSNGRVTGEHGAICEGAV